MANSYVMFSMEVRDLTADEVGWIKEGMGDWERDLDPDEDEDKQLQAFCEKWGIDDYTDWPLFDVEFYDDSAIFYSDECGNADNLAKFLKAFLAANRPDTCLGFEVAFTCSRLRPGEFGGAAYFVTAGSWDVFGTMDWLLDKRQEFERGGR